MTFVHKPKCPKFKSKMINYFCANSDFNRLNGSKKQTPKLFIKRVEVYNISKTTSSLKLMRCMVGLKMSPIACKTEITDGVKNLNSSFNIINKQTSFFENVNLLFRGYGLVCISDSHK